MRLIAKKNDLDIQFLESDRAYKNGRKLDDRVDTNMELVR